jgi:hypothetical protein
MSDIIENLIKNEVNTMEKFNFVKWFNEIGMNDVSTVGEKNASLGEMFRSLVPQGIIQTRKKEMMSLCS